MRGEYVELVGVLEHGFLGEGVCPRRALRLAYHAVAVGVNSEHLHEMYITVR